MISKSRAIILTLVSTSLFRMMFAMLLIPNMVCGSLNPTLHHPTYFPTHKWWTPCDISKVLFLNNLCKFGNKIYPPPPQQTHLPPPQINEELKYLNQNWIKLSMLGAGGVLESSWWADFKTAIGFLIWWRFKRENHQGWSKLLQSDWHPTTLIFCTYYCPQAHQYLLGPKGPS